MTIARARILDPARSTWVHCISRCVRRAFLCGDRFAHRRRWLEDRLQRLAQLFPIDVAGYAVMSNHLHLVVRMRPGDVGDWTAEEVARRWLSIYPQRYFPDGTPMTPEGALVAARARDWAWVAQRRQRLGELGWFMKALKEHIARRANREDGCTGAFWEGRFASVPLLDQPALIACMAYVDLNPVRAGLCDRPEDARHTSAWRRIRARQRFAAARRLGERAPRRAAQLMAKAGLREGARHHEDGLWLTPLARCKVGEESIAIDDYLVLVDATGRALRAKAAAIPPELPPILARLDLCAEDWIGTMLGHRQMSGGGIGTPRARAIEAARRGLCWVKNRCALFASSGDAA